jgi:hypothetical protein
MASSDMSTVYISVIDDIVANVREDFITYGWRRCTQRAPGRKHHRFL